MHAVDTDGASDVFDGLFAQIVELKTELVLNLIMYDTRDHDAPRIGECFQPGCHINAIAINVVTINDDIADIDADTKLDAFLTRDIDVTLNHAPLDVDGTSHCVHDTSKLDQHAIASGLDNAATVLGDFRVDELFAVPLKLAERAFLIEAH